MVFNMPWHDPRWDRKSWHPKRNSIVRPMRDILSRSFARVVVNVMQ